ncbi:hypothetical protein PIB30_071388 [Stylosanthes scabra]|uniref:Uncharacterized protein n=1 Tax=Stylosanthes scabra TaxID=79078 RepID=A0ABU6RPZ1_9FABA|nr:hypothetical protein [Stylosanthes scabra]
MREAQRRIESQITHLTELLTKVANQVAVSPTTSSPPPNPNSLPSQPLANPKGGINMVRKGEEEENKKKTRGDWLLELIAELVKLGPSDDEDWIWKDSDEEDSEEEELNEEEGEEEDEKEEVNEGEAKEESEAEEEEETFFVATVFEKSKVDKLKVPPKCEDPDPYLELCQLWAENVLVKVGGLTIPTDFHVIRATKGSKGGTPQVLLGRPFLKTAGFQLDYITETFSFKVGNVEETFHLVRPPSSLNKSAQQLQFCNGRDSEDYVVGEVEDKRSKVEKGKGLRDTPPRMKKKKKEPVKHTARKRNRERDSSREKIEEDKAIRKIELKCASVDDLISKLKAFKGALHNNKKLNTHLVQDHSKWK